MSDWVKLPSGTFFDLDTGNRVLPNGDFCRQPARRLPPEDDAKAIVAALELRLKKMFPR